MNFPDKVPNSCAPRRGDCISSASQRGVALVMSLLFLLLLTLLGITTLNTNTLQEKMAGNTRDSDIALQAAEAGLRGGEQAVNQLYISYPLPVGPVPSNPPTQGVWSTGSTQTTNSLWWSSSSLQYTGVSGFFTNPSYVIEYAGRARDSYCTGCPPSGSDYYRVTSHASGLTQSSLVILESTFRIRIN